ncbi:MAG: SAM-dependent methyltransferase [Clostridia bacterium]|nr:SAM-dependent methyltransferase [Clostridia bacterium]
MSKHPLDPRLSLAASLVREGARFADVGTDHAYLPLWLLSEGRLSYAVASDVAVGPLERARANVRAEGREGEVTLLLTDGLAGMEGLSLTDVAICGMGGEMIVSILAAAPFVREQRVRLILQPMTHAADLRRYLAAEGFAVLGERYATAAGKVYLCLAAEYTGEPYALPAPMAELGSAALRDARDTEAFLAFLVLRERDTRARLAGKRQGGVDARDEEELLAAIAAEREALR